MSVPQNLKYTKDHEWIRFEGETAIIGITDYAQTQLGDIVFVEIETIDNELSKGEVFGTIEAVKTVSDLFMPVAGTVLEVNPALESSPEIVNSDPYNQGWMIKISVSEPDANNDLLTAEEYDTLIG